MKKRVLFICTHNSNRSQMAEGFLRSLYPDRYEAFSAGTEPTHVSRDAIEVMKEEDVDITSHRSKNLYEYRDKKFDYVVTVCDNARETCPFFPATETQLHRSFDNPWDFHGTPEEVLIQFRRVRNEIKTWVEETFGKKDEEHPQRIRLPRTPRPDKEDK
jgi:arsenate reductase